MTREGSKRGNGGVMVVEKEGEQMKGESHAFEFCKLESSVYSSAMLFYKTRPSMTE